MRIKKSKGLINTAIDKLPLELHIPKYNFCGPGTKLEERLKKNQKGINPLDEACKEHDIAYNNPTSNRREADRILENAAWNRVKASDSSIPEKVASWLVTNTMKMKRKIGAGIQRQRTTTLKRAITAAKNVVKNSKAKTINTLTKQALLAAKKELRGKRVIGHPRILKVPKISGGFLQAVIPILSGLSALGSIVGGVSGIAKAISDFNAAKTSNKPTKITSGQGLYIKPYKQGFGIISKNY